jgi:hypothetical protein
MVDGFGAFGTPFPYPQHPLRNWVNFTKTVLTDTGKLELTIPRDRHGRFDPVLIGSTGGGLPASTTSSSHCTRAG